MRSAAIRAGALLLLSSMAAMAQTTPPVTFHKQYVQGPAGQIHVLSSMPVTRKALGTPMACFAPNPSSGNYFRQFMAVMGRDRIMIAPDYPGLGNSDPFPERVALSGYVSAMAAALEALGYGDTGKGPVDVCGYHTGAFVAQELAVSRPELVRRVVLMGIPYYETEERQAMYRDYAVAESIGERLADLQELWDFTVASRATGVTLERGYDNFIDAASARQYRPWAYHAVFSYEAEKRAPRVQQPVLILNTHGSLEQETRALAPFFPQSKLVEIPELHHGIFDVGPELLRTHAVEFLDAP